jgi:hypothetical protein
VVDETRLLVDSIPRDSFVLVATLAYRRRGIVVYHIELATMRNQPSADDALIENMLLNQRRRSTSYLRLRSLYEFKVVKVNGYPVSLSCREKNSSSSSQVASKSAIPSTTFKNESLLDSTIEFDYELLLPDPREDIVEVLQQDLPKWEFFLLYYVADDIGILGCDIGKQNINGTEGSSVDVVSLSSYGTDVIDNRVGTCWGTRVTTR